MLGVLSSLKSIDLMVGDAPPILIHYRALPHKSELRVGRYRVSPPVNSTRSLLHPAQPIGRFRMWLLKGISQQMDQLARPCLGMKTAGRTYTHHFTLLKKDARQLKPHPSSVSFLKALPKSSLSRASSTAYASR